MLEQFARLNAKSLSLKSSGLLPLLDVTDLCGVLASLPEQHSWYIYAMIDQRRSYNMEKLHVYCQQHVLQEMRSRGFKSRIIKHQDFAYGVTKAALYAHFHPKAKCSVCNGLGFKAAKQCEKCRGRGSIEYNWSERVAYGFNDRPDLTRKWYQQSCQHYDNFISSLIGEIRADLEIKLKQIKQQAVHYKYSDNEELFSE